MVAGADARNAGTHGMHTTAKRSALEKRHHPDPALAIYAKSKRPLSWITTTELGNFADGYVVAVMLGLASWGTLLMAYFLQNRTFCVKRE